MFQLGMLDNLFPLVVGVFSSDIRLVLRFPRHIPPFHFVPPDFEGDRVRTPLHELRDMPDGIFLFQKASDFFPVALRELRPRFLFFISSLSHVFSAADCPNSKEKSGDAQLGW